MAEMESRAIRIAYADALVNKLWVQGLITDIEKKRISEIILFKILP
ncbi:MAG: hypothetical protein OSJ74_07120 [Clostridia bacterium]|nr:hypothetical protein [Pumilibacter muris]MCX4363134.1 hypothetical protein [Clostridia bacterium]